MSRSSCDIRHFNIIISTAGMPSATSRPFIRSSIVSFSFAGIRIHLVQSVCASESCLASSLVMNYFLLVLPFSFPFLSTHIKSVPLLLVVARSGAGLMDCCVYPNTHRLTNKLGAKPTFKGRPSRLWNPEKREVLGHSGSPRFRLSLGVSFFLVRLR